MTLPYVMDKANCPATGNGWYYDNPTGADEDRAVRLARARASRSTRPAA